MSQKLWNEAVGQIDQDLVEEYVRQLQLVESRRKRRSTFLRLGAMAACFCLIIGAVWLLPRLGEDQPGEVPTLSTDAPQIQNPTEPTQLQTQSTEPTESQPRATVGYDEDPTPVQLSAPQYYGSELAVSAVEERDWIANAMCFTAEVVEALPDVYTCYDDSCQYEFILIKLKTVSVLKGKTMPEYFYYMIPEKFMTDFSIYHTLVIQDATQYFYEYQVVYNKTKGCAELLEYTVFGFKLRHYVYCNYVTPFDQNGNYDPRLWVSNEAWFGGTQRYMPDMTLKEAEDRIRQLDGKIYERYGAQSVENAPGIAADILERVTNLDNGVYAQRYNFRLPLNNAEGNIRFRVDRYINGFRTNEYARFYYSPQSPEDTVRTVISSAQFDADDLKVLPDLPHAMESVILAFESGRLTPPHLQGHEEMKLQNKNIFAWYAKIKEEVLGIVRVSWQYSKIEKKHVRYYYDDAYFLITYGDEECVPISRDNLLSRFGEYSPIYIYNGGYDSRGKTDVYYEE